MTLELYSFEFLFSYNSTPSFVLLYVLLSSVSSFSNPFAFCLPPLFAIDFWLRDFISFLPSSFFVFCVALRYFERFFSFRFFFITRNPVNGCSLSPSMTNAISVKYCFFFQKVPNTFVYTHTHNTDTHEIVREPYEYLHIFFLCHSAIFTRCVLSVCGALLACVLSVRCFHVIYQWYQNSSFSVLSIFGLMCLHHWYVP